MNTSDNILIDGCRKGERKAQNQLYLKYKAALFGVCLRYAKNRVEAEDLLQEGFIRIYTDLYQYKPTSPLGAWMRKVVVNVALQHIRKQKKLFTVVGLEQVKETYKSEENLFLKYRAEALIKMIQQLPDGYRAVFNLYAIEGYSHKEIAAQLNITVNTSKSQYSRAKSTLRGMLEKNVTT